MRGTDLHHGAALRGREPSRARVCWSRESGERGSRSKIPLASTSDSICCRTKRSADVQNMWQVGPNVCQILAQIGVVITHLHDCNPADFHKVEITIMPHGRAHLGRDAYDFHCRTRIELTICSIMLLHP